MKCPFTGEEYLLLRALTPDVSVIHVQVADREGNCQIAGPKWENEQQAKAAKRIVVVAEEIVTTEYIQRIPDRTIIPGHRVEAVIHQPFGAHPTTVFGCYDYDADHLRLFVQHSKNGGRIDDYLEDYVQDTKDFWGYLEKVGGLGENDPIEGRLHSGLLREGKSDQNVAEIRKTEIMAAAGARELRDGETVLVGIGLPQVACVLAKRTHAPSLTSLLEIGVINMEPKDTPIGIADSRIFYRATCWTGFLDIMGMNVHRGVVDVGFLGALEVDRYGNINTTCVEEQPGKVRYFNGSAGGNDVASLAKRVIVITRHEKRKLPAMVNYITSPGFVDGKTREELHLRGGGPCRIITDMAVIGFDPESRSAILLSVHPGVRIEDVMDNTGFPLEISGTIPLTPLPTPDELYLLREEIDARNVYLGQGATAV